MNNEAVIPSPPDERDYRVFMAMDVAGDSEIPATFEVWQPPIENQGSTGNCVAQSLANIMECIDHRDGLNHKDRSVGYIYGTQQTSGMIPREACAAVVKDGDVYRSVWEYLEENPDCWMRRQQVSQGVKDTAKRALMYLRLYTKAELQNFMLKYNLPVMITGETQYLGNSFSAGRHAVVCRGWISSEDWDKSPLSMFPYCDIHYTNSWGTGGARGDGTGYVQFENLEEVWGIVPMATVKFTDVPDNRWSAEAIRIVCDDGIMQGYPDGTFRPDKPLTREEMAAIYARMKAVLGVTK